MSKRDEAKPGLPIWIGWPPGGYWCWIAEDPKDRARLRKTGWCFLRYVPAPRKRKKVNDDV